MAVAIGWILTGTGVFGAFLNAAGRRSCFLLWIFTNAGLVVVNVCRHSWSDVALFSVYLFTAVFGWFSWGDGK